MLHIATKRELLERLIVAELVSKRGEGPLARRQAARTGRGPVSGIQPIGALAREPEPVEARSGGGSEPPEPSAPEAGEPANTHEPTDDVGITNGELEPDPDQER